MEEIFRAEKPAVNENAVNYKNPSGVKRGRNRIILSSACALIALLLAAAGVYYIFSADIPLAVVLFCCSVVYIVGCGVYAADGARLLKRPYAVLIDDRHIILREKNDYLHLPLKLMRRLKIDCEGIEAQLVVSADGKYDVLIKGDTMYYTVDGSQSSTSSKNMRKIAFVLNCLALAPNSEKNYGSRYDELLLSEHVEAEGVAAGLNKELDSLANGESGDGDKNE